MNELTKYDSIQQLKASSKPLDSTSAKSSERHARFERFINSLKEGDIKYAVPAANTTPVSQDTRDEPQ